MKGQAASEQELISELRLRDAEIDSLRTRLLHAEDEIRAVEERQHTILENPMFAIGLSDGNQILYANRPLLELFGYENLDEFISIPLIDHVAQSSRATILDRLKKIATGVSLDANFVYDIRRKDGSVRAVEITAMPSRWKGRQCRFSLFRDITERKHMEETLRESEEKFRYMFDHSTMGKSITFLAGEVNVNDALCKMLGYEREELIGRRWQDITHLDDVAVTQQFMDQLLSGAASEARFTKRFLHKNGSVVWAELASSLRRNEAGQPVYFMTAINDVTERKRAEDELRQSEERFRTYFNNSLVAMAITSPEKGWQLVNDRLCEILGYSRDELSILSWASLTHPEDLESEIRQFNRVVSGEIDTYSLEKRFIRKDGSIVDTILSVSVVRNSDGSPHYFLAQIQDITERMKAEEALRESEVRFRTLIENSPVAIAVDRNSLNLYANKAYLKMFGFERLDEIVGQPISDHWSPEWRTFFGKRNLQRSQGLDVPPDYEAIAQRKDGSQFPAHIVTTTMDLPDGRTTVGFVMDLSERKRAEEEKTKLEHQLQQAQKMESVGRLAGGVAHDFNNMLGVILGYAEIALDQIDPAQPLYDGLKEIQKAAERSANLTQQLLAFARKQTIMPRVLDLNGTIVGMLKMLERMIGENILLKWQPAADLWPVRMDPSQVDQILANLCVNARDAIGDTGKVAIKTENCILDKDFCAVRAGCVPGEYVRLAVSDDGCGMERETLGHVFEPFFTTKGAGVGTGLGLSTVYGTVKQNNGFIYVDSEPGLGTTIAIYLPRHRDKTEAGQAQMEVTGPSKRGQETILLVEDEPAIMKLAAAILKRHGYTALTASTPGEAIRLAREYAGEIHLLMTDVIMPEMNGRDLANNLLSLYPYLKLLFMSGYTADVIAHHCVLEEGVGFIQKPFSAQNLANKVKEVLDREAI